MVCVKRHHLLSFHDQETSFGFLNHQDLLYYLYVFAFLFLETYPLRVQAPNLQQTAFLPQYRFFKEKSPAIWCFHRIQVDLSPFESLPFSCQLFPSTCFLIRLSLQISLVNSISFYYLAFLLVQHLACLANRIAYRTPSFQFISKQACCRHQYQLRCPLLTLGFDAAWLAFVALTKPALFETRLARGTLLTIPLILVCEDSLCYRA